MLGFDDAHGTASAGDERAIEVGDGGGEARGVLAAAAGSDGSDRDRRLLRALAWRLQCALSCSSPSFRHPRPKHHGWSSEMYLREDQRRSVEISEVYLCMQT